MDWQNAPAGNAIDRLIGAKLFGYTVADLLADDLDNPDAPMYCLFEPRPDDAPCLVHGLTVLDMPHATENDAWGTCPPFSTDITWAWTIMNALQAKLSGQLDAINLSWCCDVDWDFTPRRWHGEVHWDASLASPKNVGVLADTVELAICRAALAWLAAQHDGA